MKRLLWMIAGSATSLLFAQSTQVSFSSSGALVHSVLANVRVILGPLPSTQRPQITVLHDGKPVVGARVYVDRGCENRAGNETRKPHPRLITNRNGQVVLPSLPPAIYCVIATKGTSSKGEIMLGIVPKQAGRDYAAAIESGVFANQPPAALSVEGAFSVDLIAYPTQEQFLAEQERLPVTKIAAFGGTVYDPSGASIPNVSVQVTRMDIHGKRRAIGLKADAQGKFSAKLQDGDYIATFAAQGFQVSTLHLKVSGAGNAAPLHIELKVGAEN